MPSDAFVLGFDTSAAHCAAALLCGDRLISLRHEEMAKGQAERLLPLLEQVLTDAGTNWGNLSAIGVGVGPGNFTGLRISVSAARGLALGLRIPAVAVSSLEALAFGAGRPALASMDARRGQVYVQRFEANLGTAAGPLLVDAESVPLQFQTPGLAVIGEHASAIASRLDATAAHPAHPTAEAIARLAHARYQTASERPAPLYIRPADAAPPREATPDMIP